jgi:hypothetical protein
MTPTTDLDRTLVATPACLVGAAFRLLVIDEDQVRRFGLPPDGTVVVGRSLVADLRLDYPQISRRHVELSTGDQVRVRDLGSLNGVEVCGRRVPVGEAIAVNVGEPILLGGVTVVVQHAVAAADGLEVIVDTAAHEVRWGEITISLSRRPVMRRLLYELASAEHGWYAPKRALVRAVWNVGYHPLRHDNVLRVTIHHLRALLEQAQIRIEMVERAGCAGYRLVPPPRSALRVTGGSPSALDPAHESKGA